jgi:hypothetical protein
VLYHVIAGGNSMAYTMCTQTHTAYTHTPTHHTLTHPHSIHSSTHTPTHHTLIHAYTHTLIHTPYTTHLTPYTRMPYTPYTIHLIAGENIFIGCPRKVYFTHPPYSPTIFTHYIHTLHPPTTPTHYTHTLHTIPSFVPGRCPHLGTA